MLGAEGFENPPAAAAPDDSAAAEPNPPGNGAQSGNSAPPGSKAKSKAEPPLRAFAREVIRLFEPYVKTPQQQDIWFRRNCRCLRDIFNFCGQDSALALQTIQACVERLQKAGLPGGYEAVCRNLPDYYAAALKAKQEAPQ